MVVLSLCFCSQQSVLQRHLTCTSQEPTDVPNLSHESSISLCDRDSMPQAMSSLSSWKSNLISCVVSFPFLACPLFLINCKGTSFPLKFFTFHIYCGKTETFAQTVQKNLELASFEPSTSRTVWLSKGQLRPLNTEIKIYWKVYCSDIAVW
jgi:hypothetical protein